MWIAQQAAIEATKQLEIIKPSWNEEIDIFSIIEDAGLPLMLKPMRRLLGAYLPADVKVDSTAGILVNSNHPRSLQRYTAAHEFAHHLQDRALSLDEHIEVLERRQQALLEPRERFAEVFASWFLMPPQLVTNLTKRLGIDPKSSGPEEVYQLSLVFGTSYKATIAQLLSLREITFGQATVLRKTQPKEIKLSLSWDEPLANSRNDIWFITENYNGHTIHPRVGDEVHLSMAETPSTGYVWVPVSEGPKMSLANQRFIEVINASHFDAEGEHEFRFILNEPGRYNLALSMRRPWLNIRSQVNQFNLDLLIEEEHEGINPNFLLAGAGTP
jgi:Zn-dependent peptidase ImmA (M78 family)/predicted secreted protein